MTNKNDNFHSQLYEVIAQNNTPDGVMELLNDLCTFKEVEQMAQRVESAKLLIQGNTYEQIIAQTGISSATLSRVSRCIQYGSGGYKKSLERIIEENKNEKN